MAPVVKPGWLNLFLEDIKMHFLFHHLFTLRRCRLWNPPLRNTSTSVADSTWTCYLTSIGISIVKNRRSHNHLFATMWFPVLVIILTRGPVYPAKSIPWWLMAWWCKEPMHHQLWGWPIWSGSSSLSIKGINKLGPRQNGHRFADAIFKCIFLT